MRRIRIEKKLPFKTGDVIDESDIRIRHIKCNVWHKKCSTEEYLAHSRTRCSMEI